VKYRIAINERKFDVEVVGVQAGIATVVVNGESYDVTIENYRAVAGAEPVSAAPAAPAVIRPAAAPSVVRGAPQPVAAPAEPAARPAPAGGTAIVAPMPGLLLDVKVNVGATVAAGQAVAILEAMKMENQIFASVSGQVMEVRAPKGSEVSTGDVILIIG
jgi:biotin carboxyl carrier protein